MTLTIVAWVLMAFAVWYVSFRLKRLLGLKRAWPLALVSAAVLGGYMLILQRGIYTSDSATVAVIYNVLGLLFVFFIYLFFLMVLTQPLALLGQRVAKRWVGIGALAASAFFVMFGFINAQSFDVTHHDIAVKNLKRPVKIVHVPDIHLGTQRGADYLGKVLATIEEQKPDFVLYNGDLVDSDIALKPELFALFKSVKADQYFTTGNHEFYMDTNRALQLIEGAGIRILRSELVDTHGIQLIGMEYMNADRETWDAHVVNTLTLQEELPRIARDGSKPSVLVHHSPVGMRYAADGNIDVMLAGHTHAGQFFPGTFLVRYRFPMHSGRHQIDGLTLLVSQGAGTFGPWMRLGSRNEVQVVNLVPAA
ncbi:putative MPP superfamily phosphohydrolase [Pseudomonas citronellolis]|uniref:metallophosphoesterase n=1 Tax=Pseudomonas citronellolis TaxID=53408 RepID=UPI00209E025D|nr:metallophosphoesterase [Pseudomonas citronellolis]MCP1644991.1 putative MPP superfamily phosphohydrolase [Pseudomonas citronellolis]MCP1668009.1 putative MPP superfamily phosphohydrolase [Pseudomonas citronellolis]MCP1699145.1 putative MPP superfamily phosphohydrolase [Pseudomonas citronellolis]MCP1705676.1 putative MPP superfamily phosphohydrolase [Pseudomonas citronellolis]MCP1799709.1 putative MPP superfamily phosphohydrolase [Pseudomonas citronellolis]